MVEGNPHAVTILISFMTKIMMLVIAIMLSYGHHGHGHGHGHRHRLLHDHEP